MYDISLETFLFALMLTFLAGFATSIGAILAFFSKKVFEDGKKIEVDFYVKGHYIPVVTVEQENIEQNIDTLVQEVILQDFKIEEKKQIHALAYAINVMNDKISENERSIAQLRIDKEEIEKEFAGILKSINAYKKVSI